MRCERGAQLGVGHGPGDSSCFPVVVGLFQFLNTECQLKSVLGT